ncbi:MAG: signal peptide peptidase SppA [Candidatus Fermentibacterota bacterium]
MRRTFALALLVAFAVFAGPIAGPQPLFSWPAFPEAGSPDLANPAGYVLQPDVGLQVGLTLSDSTVESPDRAALLLPGAGISGWWCDDQGLRRFDTGFGAEILEGMASFGLGYTWFDPTASDSPWEGASAWTLGFLVRPVPYAGLGAVRRSGVEVADGNIDPEYRLGVALRPAGRLLTLTGSYRLESDDADDEITGGLELRALEGLALRLEAGEDHFRGGLALEMGSAQLASAGTVDDGGEYQTGRLALSLTSRPRENLLQGGGRFVRFTPGQTDELRTRAFFGPVEPCFTDRMLMLDRMAGDPDVAGVILDITEGVGNLAQAEELREALRRIRSRGGRIYVYSEGLGNASYYVATLAKGIYMHPSGGVSFLGLSSFGLFARDLLDRLGIHPDLQHIGRYKSASDMFTRSDMSDAQREATRALLEAEQAELIRGVANGWGLEPAQLRLAMENGPHTARQALEAGLVSDIAHRDEVEDLIEADLGREIGVESLEEYRASIPVEDPWRRDDHVAVLVASGAIVNGESGPGGFMGGAALGDESFGKMVQRALAAPGVRALVVRIDSPGGDALASENMLHALDRAGEKVPVVVSMGGVAASGGYYMACGADMIFADRTTITGSIGIISGKFSFGGTLDSIGVAVEEVPGAARSGMGSPFRRYTPEERERRMEMLWDGYRLFVSRVAEGRGMTYEEVDSIARGRVWAGSDALEIGLVDRNGGVLDAVREAGRMVGMDRVRAEDVRVYPTPDFPGTISLPGPFGAGAETVLDLLGEERTLYLMAPFVME